MEIVSLWRYPVKSMMGEELNKTYITEKGLLGDRAYGVVDNETGKLANAKNPKKWPNMFRYRAAYTEPIELSSPIPSVRITMPDGQSIVSTEEDINSRLTESFQRNVTLRVPTTATIEFEEYVPEGIQELENPGEVLADKSPEGTFFDLGMLHLITTSTINTLRKLTPESRIEPRRFRPNIIINVQEEGFVEDKWVDKVISIGNEVQLKITRPTPRCVMTTLAQGDLPNDPNVLRTLVQQNNGNFGVYAEVIQPGVVKIGDEVVVD